MGWFYSDGQEGIQVFNRQDEATKFCRALKVTGKHESRPVANVDMWKL